MRPGISFAGVRFNFDDPEGNRRFDIGALEYAAEKGGGDLEYITRKETTTRTAQSVKVVHRAIEPMTPEHMKQLEDVHFSQQTGERWHTNVVPELLTFDGRDVPKVGEIWTIGHSTRSIEEFLALLHDHAISSLVDVRSYPGSRRCPQFGHETMITSLANDAITYRHARDLGGRRNRQHDVDPTINAAWQNASFRNYADYTLGDTYPVALANLAAMAQTSRVAFMCSEALPWKCHRSLIADSLVVRGWAVHHLMSVGKVIEHRLGQWGPEPFVADGRVTYPEPKH
jgi:hypothetical protein